MQYNNSVNNILALLRALPLPTDSMLDDIGCEGCKDMRIREQVSQGGIKTAQELRPFLACIGSGPKSMDASGLILHSRKSGRSRHRYGRHSCPEYTEMDQPNSISPHDMRKEGIFASVKAIALP